MPGYHNNVEAYIKEHNIKTRQFGKKEEESKKFVIGSNSQRPTRGSNQKKQFTTTTTESFVPMTTPATYSSDPDHPQTSIEYKYKQDKTNYRPYLEGRPSQSDLRPEGYQYYYDPFQGYEDYEEERTYLDI